MRLTRIVRQRLRSIFRPAQVENDLQHELAAHLEQLTNEHRQAGLDDRAASDAAHRTFGAMAITAEQCRDARRVGFLQDFGKDLAYASRLLAKSPGFTAVAVMSLALGIGANTAIFTLINDVLLEELPVNDPQELVRLQWAVPAGQEQRAPWMNADTRSEDGQTLGAWFSYPSFQRIRAHNQAFSDVFAFADLGDHMNVVADGEAGLARGQIVSGNYFSTLGVHAPIGRAFGEADDQPGATPVCVIGDGYWRRRFGGDRSVVGQLVTIGGSPFTIVGVTPREFFGLQPGFAIDFWVPLVAEPLVVRRSASKLPAVAAPDYWWLQIMGRLKPGVSERQARAGLDVIFRHSVTDGVTYVIDGHLVIPSLELVPGSRGLDELRRQFSRPLLILMAMVGLVLLIACANVANLLLARATSRKKEIGVRLSLGASRGRLIRQLFTESLLLASFGTALGLAFAWWGSSLLVTFLSPPGRPLSLTVTPDLRIMVFAIVACIFTALLFGLAPAFRATRVDLAPALKNGAQGSGQLRLGLGKILVVGQAALSLVLVFGAILFVRTLVNLESLNAGFDKENLLLFGVNPAKAGYKASALNDFYGRVQERVAALPGVISATSSLHLLLSGSVRDSSIWVQGFMGRPEDTHVNVMPAGAHFFHTMKIPLLRGRDFTERDTENAPKVAVINEALAKLCFLGRDPMGQRIAFGRDEVGMEIVGVAKDARYNSLRQTAPPTLYQPFRQAANVNWMYFEVRTAGDPRALIAAVPNAVASLDRNVPLFAMKTQTQQIDELLSQERLFAKLSTFFGLLALLLACVGLYGIMSYAVVRRTGEIGMRMALGAQHRNILSMFLREMLLLVAVGLALGIPACVVTARLAASVVSGLLYGVKPNDGTTIVMAGAVLIVLAVFAGFVPARRAAHVDAMVALRHE
jgi:predicted permease